MARPACVSDCSAETIRQLRSKPQLVDLMRKGMAALNGALEVIVQIVHMHLSITETSTGRDVKIPNDFVHPEASLDPATLLSLLV